MRVDWSIFAGCVRPEIVKTASLGNFFRRACVIEHYLEDLVLLRGEEAPTQLNSLLPKSGKRRGENFIFPFRRFRAKTCQLIGKSFGARGRKFCRRNYLSCNIGGRDSISKSTFPSSQAELHFSSREIELPVRVRSIKLAL